MSVTRTVDCVCSRGYQNGLSDPGAQHSGHHPDKGFHFTEVGTCVQLRRGHACRRHVEPGCAALRDCCGTDPFLRSTSLTKRNVLADLLSIDKLIVEASSH